MSVVRLRKQTLVQNTETNADMIDPWVADFLQRIADDDRRAVIAVVGTRHDAVTVRNAVRDDEQTSIAFLFQTGATPLIIAAINGHEKLTELLCQNDANVDDSDDEGWTALLNACAKGHSLVAEILVKHGADVELPDLMGWTPLMWAAYKNRVDILAMLLNNCARPNLVDEEDGLTPLMVSAGRGYQQIVEQLFVVGVEVNACDKFGNTSLIWAARRGFAGIVELLLNAGAEIDSVGMYSSTALILATRGNYSDVVELLLSRQPNANAIDNNGHSALSIAAREGYTNIALALLDSGAYVNVVDRMGDPLLHGAVRSANVDIVVELLAKYADINARDSDGRTAIHLAVEKGYFDIVIALLDRKPNLEYKNKDGETVLLRAVRSRNTTLTQLLVHSGAKVSAFDHQGDNCLHLALRARSRHLTQLLLARPSDARLLYRPNKKGVTPYSIDQETFEPILPFIFGPGDSSQSESMLGYDVYSDVLADILCEPNLSLPLTVGLYAKWGSGKSFLLNKMKCAMQQFSRSWLESTSLPWSWTVLTLLALCGLFISVVVNTLVALWVIHVSLIELTIFTLLVIVSLIVFYAFLYYGSELRGWYRCSLVANTLGRHLAYVRLFCNVVFFHPPILREKDLIACPVSFLFADYHRLSSIGGEQALVKILVTLIDAAETHYGFLTVRLFCALDRSYARTERTRLRRMCGIPVLFIGIVITISFLTSLVLICIFLTNSHNSATSLAFYQLFDNSFLIIAFILLTISLLVIIYPAILVVRYGMTNAIRRRINAVARSLHRVRFEGLMQRLQQEVELLADLVVCLDGFTRSQTRLAVIVDGLDNCEQDKMVQTLDAVDLLFCSRHNRPFVVTIAVDPHIIISAINHNMHSALTGTELTGHDYLKNIVSMPFYLHNSALRQLQTNLRARQQSLAQWRERFVRQESLHMLTGSSDEMDRRLVALDTKALGRTLLTDDYFSNINPRSMKRIVHALTLTGRLMRAFEVNFSWLLLAHWVSLVEQWPYRVSWLIDYCYEMTELSDFTSLVDVYDQVRMRIPKLRSEDPLVDIDRNPSNFEPFLRATSMSGPEPITVGHLKQFVPCTANLDPYIRKLIRERQLHSEDEPVESPSHPSKTTSEALTDIDTPMNESPIGPARYLFKDNAIWSSIALPLEEMTINDVTNLIARMDMPDDRRDHYVHHIDESNLNGLVLSICDLADVKDDLQMTLGDWTMFKLLIDTLREWTPMANRKNNTGRQSWTPDGSEKCPQKSPDSTIKTQKTAAESEVENEHQWLMAQFGRMDSVAFSGDRQMSISAKNSVSSSKTSSVRFEKDVESEQQQQQQQQHRGSSADVTPSSLSCTNEYSSF